jgi:hypothetical protein
MASSLSWLEEWHWKHFGKLSPESFGTSRAQTVALNQGLEGEPSRIMASGAPVEAVDPVDEDEYILEMDPEWAQRLQAAVARKRSSRKMRWLIALGECAQASFVVVQVTRRRNGSGNDTNELFFTQGMSHRITFFKPEQANSANNTASRVSPTSQTMGALRGRIGCPTTSARTVSLAYQRPLSRPTGCCSPDTQQNEGD